MNTPKKRKRKAQYTSNWRKAKRQALECVGHVEEEAAEIYKHVFSTASGQGSSDISEPSCETQPEVYVPSDSSTSADLSSESLSKIVPSRSLASPEPFCQDAAEYFPASSSAAASECEGSYASVGGSCFSIDADSSKSHESFNEAEPTSSTPFQVWGSLSGMVSDDSVSSSGQ